MEDQSVGDDFQGDFDSEDGGEEVIKVIQYLQEEMKMKSRATVSLGTNYTLLRSVSALSGSSAANMADEMRMQARMMLPK